MDAFLATAQTKFSASARFEGWSKAHEDALRGLSQRGFVCRREKVDMYSDGVVPISHVDVTAVHFLCLLAAGRLPTAEASNSQPRPRSESVDLGGPV